MKKLKLLFFILIMLTLYDGYSQSKKTSLTLTIEVASFENTKGVLRVCVTDQKDDFLKSCAFSKIVTVEDDTVSLKIENIEKGNYAVSVYHDENNSGISERKVQVKKARSGDICSIVGIEDFEIGDTIADIESPEELPRIAIDKPTMSMLFTINNSPFFGKEGKYVTSRHIRDRLYAELERNLALKVDDGPTEDKFNVYGRGILHLSVLIETMRREGFELQVGKPQVIYKEIDGVKCEPMESLVIDVPDEFSGKAIELVSQRKGDMLVMEPKGSLQHLEFDIPSRGLIGLRNNILTATAGNAVMTHRFREYAPIKGDIPERMKGSLISMEAGVATAFSINKLQDRGRFFISPGAEIYKGQVIGENTRNDDLSINVIKGKKLTNMRTQSTDAAVQIEPKIDFSLEESMEFIQVDEYLEVTPSSLRMRKIGYGENKRGY